MSDALIATGQHTFARRFGDRPTSLSWAPGRVNLIGDHTDYNGLPVLPMTIQRGVRILFRERPDSVVRLANVDDHFPPRTFEAGRAIAPAPDGDWVNYVKGAAQALAERDDVVRGFDGVVVGDVPVAEGLSSSSALTVAAALAFIRSSRIEIEPLELMGLLARGERYVGTEGGGMDHAICLGGRRGTAFQIDFDPLALTPTPVPPDWTFVVASSLVRAEKSGSARDIYNLRGQECRHAIDMVRMEVSPPREEDGYRQLLAHVPAGDLLRQSEEILDDPLRRRFRHVVTEATRVGSARRAMVEGDLAAFGRLMTESHRSLRDDFEVSCGPLDELCEIALAAGAAGARLTGAGFGGCVVALCPAEQRAALLERLTREFYVPRDVADPLTDHLNVAHASDGADVYTL